MTKARNNTVIYFPHDCNPGRTIGILKSLYGNDGFAFWYQLLQILGRTDGHYFSAAEKMNWLHLVAETSVSEELAENILTTLVDLEAIDRDLWKFDRVIWSGNFVENLASLYRGSRHKEPPPKPQLRSLVHEPPAKDGSGTDIPRRGPKVDGCPHSKVKKSIVKKNLSSDPGPDDTPSKTKEWPEPIKHLCKVFEELNLAQDPKNRTKSMAKWLKDMELLVRVDERDPEEVERVIRWGKRDSFWGAVLMTPGGLRKNYVKLLINAKNGGNYGTHKNHENSRPSSEFDGGTKVTSNGPV